MSHQRSYRRHDGGQTSEEVAVRPATASGDFWSWSRRFNWCYYLGQTDDFQAVRPAYRFRSDRDPSNLRVTFNSAKSFGFWVHQPFTSSLVGLVLAIRCYIYWFEKKIALIYTVLNCNQRHENHVYFLRSSASYFYYYYAVVPPSMLDLALVSKSWLSRCFHRIKTYVIPNISYRALYDPIPETCYWASPPYLCISESMWSQTLVIGLPHHAT